MAVDNISIGLRIKHLRSEKHITQEQLAEAIDSDRSTIAHIEIGQQGLSIDTLIAISNALKVSSDDILVDNLLHPFTNQDTDAHYLLLDCTQQETKIIIETMRSLREALKKYTSK